MTLGGACAIPTSSACERHSPQGRSTTIVCPSSDTQSATNTSPHPGLRLSPRLYDGMGRTPQPQPRGLHRHWPAQAPGRYAHSRAPAVELYHPDCQCAQGDALFGAVCAEHGSKQGVDHGEEPVGCRPPTLMSREVLTQNPPERMRYPRCPRPRRKYPRERIPTRRSRLLWKTSHHPLLRVLRAGPTSRCPARTHFPTLFPRRQGFGAVFDQQAWSGQDY